MCFAAPRYAASHIADPHLQIMSILRALVHKLPGLDAAGQVNSLSGCLPSGGHDWTPLDKSSSRTASQIHCTFASYGFIWTHFCPDVVHRAQVHLHRAPSVQFTTLWTWVFCYVDPARHKNASSHLKSVQIEFTASYSICTFFHPHYSIYPFYISVDLGFLLCRSGNT